MTDKDYDLEFVKKLLEADEQPPEAEFDNIEDLLEWLDDDANWELYRPS